MASPSTLWPSPGLTGLWRSPGLLEVSTVTKYEKDVVIPEPQPMLNGHKTSHINSPFPKSSETVADRVYHANKGTAKIDIEAARAAVCFMGIPENLVQLAITNQRLKHGAEFTDVKDLYLAAQEILQNQEKESELMKSHGSADAEEKEAKEERKESTDLKTQGYNFDDIGDSAKLSAGMLKPTGQITTGKHMLHEKVKMLQKVNRKLKRRKMCRACLKVDLASSGITFLPCGHFITCENCSEKFDNCPACNKNIMGTVRTFLC